MKLTQFKYVVDFFHARDPDIEVRIALKITDNIDTTPSVDIKRAFFGFDSDTAVFYIVPSSELEERTVEVHDIILM